MKRLLKLSIALTCLLLQLLPTVVHSQPADFSVSLATVDAGMLSKKSMFAFQVTSTLNTSKNLLLKGTVKYRNQPYKVTYTLRLQVQPGVNNIAEQAHRAVFEYSSSSVKELLELFDRLPEGMLQYCVTLASADGETTIAGVEDCIFGKNEDLFLINLIDPENKAELYEFNPMLSWVANYPFASSLAYRIKVVEMKKDQNAVNAIKRNNPVYEEKGLMQMSINYPIYAKPLQVGSTYAWTVDAYYKDLLLGGAEPWQFTIIEDSLLKSVPREISYYDFARHMGETRLYAVDTLKLKYETRAQNDTLKLTFIKKGTSGKEIHQMNYPTVIGLNYIALPLEDYGKFSHNQQYSVRLINQKGKAFDIPFLFIKSIYLNNK